MKEGDNTRSKVKSPFTCPVSKYLQHILSDVKSLSDVCHYSY